ncbi:MAG TPA: hypothetical protein EYG57_10280, partial [Planctomycetes bacterium]|nr:hypothetical protein [Planctomycetota bacterium]
MSYSGSLSPDRCIPSLHLMAFQDSSRDVRMRGFASRTSVADALAWLDGHTGPLTAENVALSEGAGRVLATEMVSQLNVPPFPRGMMDG